MTNSKIIKVDQDCAIAWAFHFMQRNYMSVDEINNYLEILRGILPDNNVLFGVSNALGFVLDRYPNVFKCVDDIVYIELNYETSFLFKTNSYSINLYEQACDILKAIEETTDEIKTSDNIVLKQTI